MIGFWNRPKEIRFDPIDKLKRLFDIWGWQRRRKGVEFSNEDEPSAGESLAQKETPVCPGYQ
jgi:hypothetical protein